jgi:hypothetical protein
MQEEFSRLIGTFTPTACPMGALWRFFQHSARNFAKTKCPSQSPTLRNIPSTLADNQKDAAKGMVEKRRKVCSKKMSKRNAGRFCQATPPKKPFLTKTGFGVLLLILCLAASALADPVYYPPKGYVPDAATAVLIAKAVSIPLYRAGSVREKTFSAKLSHGIWSVTGNPIYPSGEVIIVRISSKTGAILDAELAIRAHTRRHPAARHGKGLS